MMIKRGAVVLHSKALEWGVGKVIEVSARTATIQFNDGVVRKIASSHYTSLQLADPAFFVAIPEIIPAEETRVTSNQRKSVKQPKA